jgi:diaminohydroxyphosphoribosylaminopyrimidine deaminase/5-amino-6-(5-phosphoribosylamino)uracil reductase
MDMVDVLQSLGSAGLTRIFCEGGGALAASLLTADLVDDLIGFTAGITLGAEGRPGIGATGLAQLSEAPRFQLVSTCAVGGDILHQWTRI